MVRWAQYSSADGYMAHSGILRGRVCAVAVYCIHTVGK